MAAITSAVVGGVGTAYAANKSAKAARNSGTQQTTQEMPEWVKNQFMRAYAATNQAADRPTEEAIAGFNPAQLAAFRAIQANQGMGMADIDEATARARGLAGGATFSDVDMERYQNPFTRDVIDATLADLEQYRSRNDAAIAAEAEAAGAWGGDRAVIARSLNNESVDRAAANAIANLRSQGFNTAAGLAQNEAAMRNNFALNNLGLQLSGNAQLQSLIDQRRAAANQDAGNLLAVGNQQQAQRQAEMDWAIQRAQLMGNIASQSAGGGTTTTQVSGPKPDRFGATMQGLNAGLTFGRNIYNSFAPQVTPPDLSFNNLNLPAIDQYAWMRM